MAKTVAKKIRKKSSGSTDGKQIVAVADNFHELRAKANGEEVVKARPAHLFKPGQSGNPAGRQKGSRNVFAEAFFNDFLADWEIAGASAIQRCRLEDPSTYVRVAASLVPKELSITDDTKLLDAFLDQLTPAQTTALLAEVRAANAGAAAGKKGHKALTRAQSNGVH